MEKSGKAFIRAGYGSKRSLVKKKLNPSHPLTNFETEEYYQNENKLNDVCSRDNLPNKGKNGAYVVNLDEHYDNGTHWVALYINDNAASYFDSFEIEHIPLEVKKFINNRGIISNIYRIQTYNSVLSRYFCTGFIDFMFSGNNLTDHTNLFSRNNLKKK